MAKKLHITVVTLAALLYACTQDNAPVNISDSPTQSVAPESVPRARDPQFVGTQTGTQIMLGKAIDPDNTILSPADTFEKTDTIYVSVNTGSSSGTANSGTLTAKWSYRTGDAITPVHAESRELTATGPTISEFHIKNPQGLAAGTYQIEMLLDDRQVGVRTFTVR